MADKRVLRDCHIRAEEYEAEDFLRKLEPLVKGLQDATDCTWTPKTLAGHLMTLVNFMELALGRKSPAPRPFPKLPAKLFQDFAADGPLSIIARKLYEHIRTTKRFDLTPASRNQNLHFVGELRQALKAKGFLNAPKVHVHHTCGYERERLEQIVKKLDGDVVDERHATHVVYPFGPKGDLDEGRDYTRSLAVRGSRHRVHWWYHPDSYDEWVGPEVVGNNTLEPDKIIKGPWKVYLRWVKDSELFNEWMNPIDYETEEALHEQETQGVPAESVERAGGATASKRSREDDDTAERSSQRQRTSGPEPSGTTTDADGRRGSRFGVTRVYGADVNARVDPSASVEDISQGQRSSDHGARVPEARRPSENGSLLTPAQILNQPVKQKYKVPAHSAWFGYDRIHELERTFMPDFFSGKNPTYTPKLYREYRNAMVNKYRENVDHFFAMSDAQKLLSGDTQGVSRVWEFLNKWGLINFQAKDGPPREEASGRTLFEVSPAGKADVVHIGGLPAKDSILNLPTQGNTAMALSAAAGGHETLNLITRPDQYGRCAIKPPVAQPRFFCNAMPWVDCTQSRFHCITDPDIDLCPEAFANGRFPPGRTAKDFIRIDHAETQGNEWTPQEEMMLLEALDMFGDSWAEVAEHVGTKSQAQCVIHLSQLPIEDPYIMQQLSEVPAFAPVVHGAEAAQQTDGADAEADQANEAGGREGDNPVTVTPRGDAGASAAQNVAVPGDAADSEPPIPFADAGNPIMSQVAFLAAVVGPKVAAAAAKAALEALSDETPGLGNPNGATPPTTNGHVGGASGMSSSKLRAAAAAALGAAAVKARIMAESEEREALRLTQQLIEIQHRKLTTKLRTFEQMEEALLKEKGVMESMRDQLFTDRVVLAERTIATKSVAKQLFRSAKAIVAKIPQAQQQQRVAHLLSSHRALAQQHQDQPASVASEPNSVLSGEANVTQLATPAGNNAPGISLAGFPASVLSLFQTSTSAAPPATMGEP